MHECSIRVFYFDTVHVLRSSSTIFKPQRSVDILERVSVVDYEEIYLTCHWNHENAHKDKSTRNQAVLKETPGAFLNHFFCAQFPEPAEGDRLTILLVIV